MQTLPYVQYGKMSKLRFDVNNIMNKQISMNSRFQCELNHNVFPAIVSSTGFVDCNVTVNATPYNSSLRYDLIWTRLLQVQDDTVNVLKSNFVPLFIYPNPVLVACSENYVLNNRSMILSLEIQNSVTVSVCNFGPIKVFIQYAGGLPYCATPDLGNYSFVDLSVSSDNMVFVSNALRIRVISSPNLSKVDYSIVRDKIRITALGQWDIVSQVAPTCNISGQVTMAEAFNQTFIICSSVDVSISQSINVSIMFDNILTKSMSISNISYES
jgi:hypothetical protein